jgi:hypothetical protein
MAETASLNQQIKAPTSKVFRRFFVKRRQISDGLFEANWQDLTRFVISWGNFRASVDTPRFGDLRFDNAALRVLNIEGTFNPNDNDDSFWNTYGDIQRSLVKIEAGFTHQTLSAGGIWTNTEFPTTPLLWTGIISGDIFLAGRSEVIIPLRPVTQVFRDYLANDVTFNTAPGISSGGWFTLMRDHTDGSGNFVFRPFIGTSAANDWSIATGGNLYANLDSSGAEDLHQLDCWQVTERLANAENSFAYVNNSGKFIWQRKTATAAVQYEFHGQGSNNRTYGVTMKNIKRYGKRLTAFYSRVAVKYAKDDTNTSFVNTALTYAVAGANTAWNLGSRTFDIENFWLPNSAAAATVASQVFNEVSSQAEEFEFTTSFVPQINLMDRISVTYDATDFVSNRSLWDQNDWAATPSSNTSEDLIWDAGRGDAIILQSVNFKILSIDMDLDRMESTFIGRQLS